MNIHAYRVEIQTDSSYRLRLHEKLSTNAQGISKSLGLLANAKMELSMIETALFAKIGPSTVFNPE